MAPKDTPNRRRLTSKQSRPRATAQKPALEGSLLQRKQLCTKALIAAGSDRATAAYNALAQCQADALQAGFADHKGDTKKLGAFLIRLCAANGVSYTMDHHERSKQKRANGGTSAATRAPASLQAAAAHTPFISLDPAHWSVPVTLDPTSHGDGYKDGISLHDMAEGKCILDMVLGHGQRPPVALAIAVIGPKHAVYAGIEMALPVLKRGPRAAQPVATHIQATLYQLGTRDVHCQQTTAEVQLDPAHHVCWSRS